MEIHGWDEDTCDQSDFLHVSPDRFHRIPPSRVSQVYSPVALPTTCSPTPPPRKSYPNDDLISILPPMDKSEGEVIQGPKITSSKRLMRRVAKVTRRYQVMQRLTKSLGLEQQPTDGSSSSNGNARWDKFELGAHNCYQKYVLGDQVMVTHFWVTVTI